MWKCIFFLVWLKRIRFVNYTLKLKLKTLFNSFIKQFALHRSRKPCSLGMTALGGSNYWCHRRLGPSKTVSRDQHKHSSSDYSWRKVSEILEYKLHESMPFVPVRTGKYHQDTVCSYSCKLHHFVRPQE